MYFFFRFGMKIEKKKKIKERTKKKSTLKMKLGLS